MYKCGDGKGKVHCVRSAAALPEQVKRQAVQMRIEGASISAAARVVGASVTAVSGWLKNEAIALERMRASGRAEIIAASTIAFGEMWTYWGARKAEKHDDL